MEVSLDTIKNTQFFAELQDVLWYLLEGWDNLISIIFVEETKIHCFKLIVFWL